MKEWKQVIKVDLEITSGSKWEKMDVYDVVDFLNHILFVMNISNRTLKTILGKISGKSQSKTWSSFLDKYWKRCKIYSSRFSVAASKAW